MRWNIEIVKSKSQGLEGGQKGGCGRRRWEEWWKWPEKGSCGNEGYLVFCWMLYHAFIVNCPLIITVTSSCLSSESLLSLVPAINSIKPLSFQSWQLLLNTVFKNYCLYIVLYWHEGISHTGIIQWIPLFVGCSRPIYHAKHWYFHHYPLQSRHLSWTPPTVYLYTSKVLPHMEVKLSSGTSDSLHHI